MNESSAIEGLYLEFWEPFFDNTAFWAQHLPQRHPPLWLPGGQTEAEEGGGYSNGKGERKTQEENEDSNVNFIYKEPFITHNLKVLTKEDNIKKYVVYNVLRQ